MSQESGANDEMTVEAQTTGNPEEFCSTFGPRLTILYSLCVYTWCKGVLPLLQPLSNVAKKSLLAAHAMPRQSHANRDGNPRGPEQKVYVL